MVPPLARDYMRMKWGLLGVLAAITLCNASALDRNGSGGIRELSSAEVLEAERALLESLTAPRVATNVPRAKKDAQTPAVSAKPAVEQPQAASSMQKIPVSMKDNTTTAPAAAAEIKTSQPVAPKSPPAVVPTAAAKEDGEVKARIKSESVMSKPDPSAAALRADNEKLKSELRTLKSQVERLERELQTSRSQLATAELEVNRLSALSDAKTRSSLSRFGLTPPSDLSARSGASRPQVAPPAQREARAAIVPDVTLPSAGGSMPVATVSVGKADLRLGPGQNNSPLMSVSRGSRLLVEARQGEWYRVFAPSGERAWVHSSLVIFGDTPSQSETSRVKGFDSDLESEAFRKFNRGSGQ
jgi:outer membrane murein-binding lipoprotein Lpp